ncbi:NAD(P)H-binding protein [Flavihumibacter petaseus]|uniref:NAD(P)-binding domain-containing protein n=1 Tax=Flavihumibacter petaseus NBRC 106054 TaxID=1220578 RepID=A0A0E9MYY1_9BACT|nr:NAD(P)H-binding protein [Flavihumibacter petaseus]GAO42611.1 hypothetical protein FPE01S_01_16260 [Flavihumibacter petaseus NBRC 106054]
MKHNILLAGGSGKTGQRVSQRLQENGIPHRIGSRKSNPSFDWYDPATWPEALQDISQVYICFQPDLAVPGASEIIAEFARQMKAAGVEHAVLLSGRGEKEAENCEEVLQASGIDWTILRASWFMQNFSEGFLAGSLASGILELPEGLAREPFVDAEDLADAVVEVLLHKTHHLKTWSLTGPELLHFRDATAIITNITRQPIRYHDISMEAFRGQLEAAGLPEDYIQLISYLFSEVLDGRNESVTQDIQKLTGHPPRSFESFVRNSLLPVTT